MIEITDLCKSFGSHSVLNKLNCKIETGSIYGLVGSNGAGKSTLLRIINNIFKKDSGKITIDGQDIEENEAIKQRLVFIPDDLYFFPNYNLKEMAEFYKAMYKDFDMESVRNLAGVLKLNLNEKIKNFSKGMKRQCALICAISTNADYMFFDETFDGIDPVVRNLLKQIIRKQMEKKPTTIIMTSHNLKELEDICDNLGLLYKGGILFESDINSIHTHMIKTQIVVNGDFDKDKLNDDGLEVMNMKKVGSVITLIIKGEKEKIEEKLKSLNPVVLDFLPLTLEEVFIYEMEVLGYEFNEVI